MVVTRQLGNWQSRNHEARSVQSVPCELPPGNLVKFPLITALVLDLIQGQSAAFSLKFLRLHIGFLIGLPRSSLNQKNISLRISLQTSMLRRRGKSLFSGSDTVPQVSWLVDPSPRCFISCILRLDKPSYTKNKIR